MDFQPDLARKRKLAFLWNLMTIIVLLGIVCLVWYFVTIFRDPRFFLNPFPPEPSPTVYYTVTSTITPIQQPPTWTPTATIKPTSTRTRAPTWTPLPGQRSETPSPTITLTLTPSITSTAMPAVAEITYHPSTDVYPEKGCILNTVTNCGFKLELCDSLIRLTDDHPTSTHARDFERDPLSSL